MIPRQCVILVGGRGTRLGALTEALPKPMLPVAGRPFLDYLLDSVSGYGIEDIVLLAGYHGSSVVERYDGARFGGAAIRVVVEMSLGGTAGALNGAASSLAERFFMMNGDSVFDVDLRDLAARAAQEDGIAHLALRRLEDAGRSGIAILQGSRITGFAERGDGPGVINGGIYVLSRAICDRIDRRPMSIEAEIFPALAASGRLTGTIYDGFFLDIGIPSAFEAAQTLIPNWARRAGS